MEVFYRQISFRPKYLLRFVSTVHLLLLMKTELAFKIFSCEFKKKVKQRVVEYF